MVIADLVQDLFGIVDAITLAPVHSTVLAGVVKTVLRLRSCKMSDGCASSLLRCLLTTMQVNHDLEACLLRPAKSITELFVCTLDVWVAVTGKYTPVPNRDTDVVQTGLSHLVEIILSDPRVPVLLQA